MGLKSGSRDAGLDDAETDSDDGSERAEPQDVTDPNAETTAGDSGTDAAAESPSERPTIDAIPYKLRRDRVNEGREQVPYFLREEVIEAEDELQDTLEGLLGESVYKSDYREASMVLAQRNPELVAEILREWGYDLERS